MEGLFPIVRRKRVPLVVEDTPPVMVGNVEPVTAVAVEPAAVVPLVEKVEAEGTQAETPAPLLLPESPEPALVSPSPSARKERRAKRQE